jgi:hypothetical protein
MGAIRKPRFSDCDVEKAMDGFFNNLLDILTAAGTLTMSLRPGGSSLKRYLVRARQICSTWERELLIT